MPDTDIKVLCERMRKRARTGNGIPVGGGDGGTYTVGPYDSAAERDDREAADRLESQAAELERLRMYEPTHLQVTRLKHCLSHLGVATCESMEEFATRWPEFVSTMFSAVDRIHAHCNARAESAERHAAALAEALKPLARLEVPLRPQGNAGAYSIFHDSIRRARAALDAYRSGGAANDEAEWIKRLDAQDAEISASQSAFLTELHRRRLSRLEAALREARETLVQAAECFREYTEIHAAKKTPDGWAKAWRNAEMSGMCEGALSRIRTALNSENDAALAPAAPAQQDEGGER